MEENNLDLLCYKFNQELTELINKYGGKVPASIIYILLKDVLNQVGQEKERIIMNLFSQQQESEQTVELPVKIINEKDK